MSYRFSSLFIVSLAANVTLGCGADDVFRKVTLAPAISLPTGLSTLTGDTLSVEFTAVEPLAAGYRFVLWVRVPAGNVAVAETRVPGLLSIDLAATGLTGAAVENILITEEDAGTGLPSSVAGHLMLAGLPNEEMAFGSVEAHDLEAASGEAELHNKALHLTASGLPSLPAGYSYGVWMMFEAADDGDGHAHEGGGDMEMIHMGDLMAAAMLETDGDRMLALAHEISVTIESENGMPMMSQSTVLGGAIVLEADAEGGGEDEAEGGAHMH